MKISVTDRDIEVGVRRSCQACPVALAINRATGQTWFVGGTRAERIIVDVEDLHCVKPGEKSVPLPQSARVFIAQFDDFGLGGVKPFEFEFDWEKKPNADQAGVR